MTTFSNLKTYLPSALKHLFGCHFKHLWEKTEYYCNISVGSINGTAKTLDDLGCFDLKMFRNCPIRIEMITGTDIYIVFTTGCHFMPSFYPSLPLVVKYSA